MSKKQSNPPPPVQSKRPPPSPAPPPPKRQNDVKDGCVLICRPAEVIELREQVTELTAALEASTRELIGERDCLYESHAQPDTGEVTDDEGKQGLAELDAIIDRNQAVINKVKGDRSAQT